MSPASRQQSRTGRGGPSALDWLTGLYAGLLRFYPPGFYREFSEEMLQVFSQSLSRAAAKGATSLLRLAWREFFPLPRLIFQAHWRGLKIGRAPRQASRLDRPSQERFAASPRDGRTSLAAAALEISVFLLTGLWLLLEAYVPTAIHPGLRSQRPELLSPIVLLFILPLAVLGLLRGAPRWAFPPAGFLLGYTFMAARVYHLLSLWFFTAAGFLALAASAWKVNARWPLPAHLRLLTSRLRRDWSYFSFAVYGLAPLVIHAAFQDGFPRSSTPYLALAVAVMLLCAALFARSLKVGYQMISLVAGVSASLWLVIPHKITNPVPLPAALLQADLAWLSTVWAGTMLLLALPGVIVLTRSVMDTEKPGA